MFVTFVLVSENDICSSTGVKTIKYRYVVAMLHEGSETKWLQTRLANYCSYLFILKKGTMESHDGHNFLTFMACNDQYHGYRYVPGYSIEIK
jgi:hypothetical protein